jgi:hypothetical protein
LSDEARLVYSGSDEVLDISQDPAGKQIILMTFFPSVGLNKVETGMSR